ncbi:uncharacterized protein LOC101211303 [Cucumis sativus]|uniref:Transmembrane protein n=1 Tax=Cucumis sativus TaxID=3659 RepID=A0A0A0LJH8_CUCSA|nr:uncharacterized protein LOC101211303 [Cucumis sativus]XP_011648990.1 uncharacterized protein LOC101211303 [Cucumis sativus]KGN61244.1 hypothetical protein Csa_006652 [Cucumis sativus]
MSCPSNSFRYNGSLCACPPGQLLNRANNSCVLFSRTSAITTGRLQNYAVSFPETIFSFDSIRKITQSQAVFLEATLVMLLSWLFFCIFLRFMKLGDGRNIWFRIRWWVSRLDVCFATRHWLDDQRIVTKRKTELGGMFSIASWILFIGLFAALLYQIISKRSIEVHNVKAANAPDLVSFVNDIEFNITTVSTMSCANIRGLDTVVFGNPGFLEQKVMPLSSFANFSCQNRSEGPTISLKCERCRFIQDDVYISWQFVDLPNNPASAVGFEFNISAKDQVQRSQESFVSGTLKNRSNFDDTPVTFRGKSANIVQFNLFPRIYSNKQDSKLMQPLFHEFVSGSSFQNTNDLQLSLENTNDGLLNITLYINLLSSYIVEVESQNILGPVSFLADLGGLYCISFGIFFYLLVQFEYRIKRLRNEDSVMRKIRNRRKAQEHWNKLRKYVMYTWGCSALLDGDYNDPSKTSSCPNCIGQPSHKNGSSRKRRLKSGSSTAISFNIDVNGATNRTVNQDMKSPKATATDQEMRMIATKQEQPLHHQVLGSTYEEKQRTVPFKGDSSQPVDFSRSEDIPPPPLIDFNDSSDIDMSNILKNMKSLYEYNVFLREKLLSTQSEVRALATKSAL